MLLIGMVAEGIAAPWIGIFFSRAWVFQARRIAEYLEPVVWICLLKRADSPTAATHQAGHETTMRITDGHLILIRSSTCFSMCFLACNGGVWLEKLLTSMPGGVWGFYLHSKLVIFFVAVFLRFFEIALVFILPMVAGRLAQKMLGAGWVGADGPDLVRGTMLWRTHAEPSFLHRPFGFALFICVVWRRRDG